MTGIRSSFLPGSKFVVQISDMQCKVEDGVGVQIFERGKLLFAHLLNWDHVLSEFFYLTTERNFNLNRHQSTLRIQFPSLPKA